MESDSKLLMALEVRSKVFAAVRSFFASRGYLEVDTPIRLSSPPPEPFIEAVPSADHFLRTSPELHMKRLLAAGAERIVQLGSCFRAGEAGPRHHPEFTMLEWYRVGTDYEGVLQETRALLGHVVHTCGQDGRFVVHGQTIDPSAPWQQESVQGVFLDHAGWDPLADFSQDRFDLDMVGKVEPAIKEGMVVLRDYPVDVAALARCRPGPPPVAERWELYGGGIELANAYTELTDPGEYRQRMTRWNERRVAAGIDPYPLDEPFLEAMQRGLPDCGGVALGVDRLIMLLTGASHIADIRAFTDDGM